MKPLGRKYYKSKTGGKHKVKVAGKTCAWWINIISPNKSYEKRLAKNEIKDILTNSH
ncbi:MAG: hypothetical protein IBX55_00960 [Methyloprofundus sp.]|nr:hypothetical protein [Methyloprofundus sp.]